MSKATSIRAHVYALIAITVWGGTFVASKYVLDCGATPFDILVSRFFVAWLILTALCPHGIKFEGMKKEIPYIMCGVFGVTLYFLAENSALLHTMVSNVGILTATAPLITALIFWAVYKERPSVFFVIGFVIAIVGVALVALNGKTPEFQFSLYGDFLCLLAASSWGVYSIGYREISKRHNPKHGPAKEFNSLAVTKRIFFWGLVSMVVLSPFMGFNLRWLDVTNPVLLLALAFLALLGSSLCYVLWNNVIKELGEVRACVYLYAIPAVTVVAAFILLNERLSLGAIVGIVLILVGLVVSNKKSAPAAS